MEENTLITVGRRKTSVARIRMQPGIGEIVINKRSVNEYFGRDVHRAEVIAPFKATESLGKWNVSANVNGGGETGQAGAIRHGIARALLVSDPTLRAALKKDGLLTRDPRMKERKKYGQKGARARFQFSKR